MELQAAVLVAALVATVAMLGGYALSLRSRLGDLERRHREAEREHDPSS